MPFVSPLLISGGEIKGTIKIMEKKKLLAFHGDKKLKSAMLAEVKKHEKADQIIQGTYGRQNGDWKGCAVACSVRSLAKIKGEKLVEQYNSHSRYEIDLGIPLSIAYLEDSLFEGMEVEDAKKFPAQFIKAIPVGADLSLVSAKFMVFVLNDTLQHKEVLKNEKVVKAVKGVIQLWEDVINGKYVGKDKELESAESAARSAAWSAAESAAYKRFADHLLELLKKAK